MVKKIIVFAFIAWAFAAISSPRYAKAVVAIPQLEDVNATEITEVIVTGKPFKPLISPLALFCGGNFSGYFYYQQFMAIPEVGMVRVITDAVYNPGLQAAVFREACVGADNITYYTYDLNVF